MKPFLGPAGLLPARQDLSHAQPQRASSDVPSCEEGAFEVLAVQIDFVLACDALWLRVLLVRCVYPYFAIGNALAFAVWDAPSPKDINVRPLPLPEIIASKCARWKTRSGKQNEFS